MTKELTNFERVVEFTEIFDHKRSGDTRDEKMALRLKLIQEECQEVSELLDGTLPFDRAKLAKELADLLYVVYGTADVFDINIDQAFREVHDSNLTKLSEDGTPIFREDGKVLKGPNYAPPNLDWVKTQKRSDWNNGD